MKLAPRPVNAHVPLKAARGGDRVATLAVLVHDTVTGPSWTKARVERMVSGGVTQKLRGGKRRHIPGPLYNWLIHPDGEIVQITRWRARANHAGVGVEARLRALEQGTDPRAEAAKPSVGGLNANGHLVGVALNRSGKHPVPMAQKMALYYLLWADDMHLKGLMTLCPDKQPFRILGHRDWSPGRKVDPELFDLDEIRTAPDPVADQEQLFLDEMVHYLRVGVDTSPRGVGYAVRFLRELSQRLDVDGNQPEKAVEKLMEKIGD